MTALGCALMLAAWALLALVKEGVEWLFEREFRSHEDLKRRSPTSVGWASPLRCGRRNGAGSDEVQHNDKDGGEW